MDLEEPTEGSSILANLLFIVVGKTGALEPGCLGSVSILPLTSHVTLGELLNLPLHSFPHL